MALLADEMLFAPKVTLIGMTQWEPPKLADHAWDSSEGEPVERLIEYAGRLCYRSFHNPSGRTNAEYIRNLLEKGHLSVIEHASASFLIERISRSCSHEIVRHRHFSYSQVSQRYVDESRARMVMPPAMADDSEAQAILEEVAKVTKTAYVRLVEILGARYAHVQDTALWRKLARQAARAALPNMTETALVMTGNFRAWRHFIRLRATPEADPEIRTVAVAVLEVLRDRAPAVFGDFNVRELEDGSRVATTPILWE